MNEIADSTQGADTPRVNGTVVAEPTPVCDSPHPYTEEQVPLSVNPLPAVKEEEGKVVSAFPITNDEAIGVNEATDGVVEPPGEFPVEVSRPAVVAPLIS